MPARHDDAQFLRHLVRLALAANARRIDEDELDAFVLDRFVDGIARGACDRRDDGAFLADQRIQQS